MSSTNLFETRRKAFVLRTFAISTSSTVTTYTAKVGTVANNFVVDRVIDVTTTANNDITITVPDGQFEGQRLLINFTAEGSAETVTVAASTGTGGDSTMTSAGQYMSLEWVNSTTGWVALSESVAT